MEIGSIFEIDLQELFFNQDKQMPLLPVQNRLNLSAFYFNTGRAAIEMLLKKLKKTGLTRVLLPAFLCDSVRDAALRSGMEICYYRVNTDLSIDVSNIQLDNHSVLYVLQFFGQRLNQETLSLVKQFQSVGGTVIEDISLALLSDDESYVGFGDYIIGSLRKWFPIIDGGILLSKELAHFELADAANDYTLYYFTAQILKDLYLKSDNRDQGFKRVFLSYNAEGMKSLFSDYTPRAMSKVSVDLMKGLDLRQIRDRRNKNYDTLRSLISGIPQISVLVDRKGTMTPLGMVILCEERERLLQYLISKDVYCNVHWRSNESTKHFQESEYLAAKCITIPCDQRYSEEEMNYIAQSLAKFFEV
jgi:hypothetical protein